MAKQMDFGGIPQDMFDALIKKWGTAAGAAAPAVMTDRVNVLEALAKERHKAANPSDNVDIVDVVMKVIAVRDADAAVSTGAPATNLVTALDQLRAVWGP